MWIDPRLSPDWELTVPPRAPETPQGKTPQRIEPGQLPTPAKEEQQPKAPSRIREVTGFPSNAALDIRDRVEGAGTMAKKLIRAREVVPGDRAEGAGKLPKKMTKTGLPEFVQPGKK